LLFDDVNLNQVTHRVDHSTQAVANGHDAAGVPTTQTQRLDGGNLLVAVADGTLGQREHDLGAILDILDFFNVEH
jgi:hypothetical protein